MLKGFELNCLIFFFLQDAQSNAPILYLWYAEAELANNSGIDSESSFRAIHILCCLGSGLTYSTFKCQPSNLQILRARQGYMEKTKALRSAWLQGAVTEQSVALICSAALFEELTQGWDAGIEVLNMAFSTVLPGYLDLTLICYSYIHFNPSMGVLPTCLIYNEYLMCINMPTS